MPQYHSLTIAAQPHTELQILVRDHGDPQPPPVLRAATGVAGTIEIRIPDGYYVVLGDGYKTHPLKLTASDDDVSITLTRA